MNPDGYPSDEDDTLVDHGFAAAGPASPTRRRRPTRNGVVTPHAVFLALRYAPQAALANLAKLAATSRLYGKWGFHDSVNVQSGTVADPTCRSTRG